VDLRPLYQRSRALFLANAPHASRHRPGLRAARAVPCVGERCGSDADALSAAALAAGESHAARDCRAVASVESSRRVFGESFIQSVGESISESFFECFGGSLCLPVGISLTERFARVTQCVAFRVSRAVGIRRAGSDAVTRRA
jgi:hypothetical protein